MVNKLFFSFVLFVASMFDQIG
jgi:hypothetical protein